MGVGRKIKTLRLSLGWSQKQMAEKAGITQPTLSYLEKTDPISSKTAERIVEVLGIPIEEFLSTSTSTPTLPANLIAEVPKTEPEIVFVPEYRIEFSAGEGCEFAYETVEEGTPKAYSLSFFQVRRINPEKCKRFKVSGNSMEPLLYDGDSILVAEEPVGTAIRDGQVYIVRYDNDLKVKRLSKNFDGSITLRSVNPQYPDYTVSAEDVGTRFSVLGRVIEKSGCGGLAG